MGIESIKIVIPGNPISKKRPRFTQRGMFPVVYDPQSKEKNLVKEFLEQELDRIISKEGKRHSIKMNRILMGRPVSIRFHFYFNSKTESYWNDTFHTMKPDLDNLEKFYLDCANGVLFFDDKQVVELSSKKEFSKIARTEIEIMQKDPLALHKSVRQIIKIIDPDTLSDFINDTKVIEALLEVGVLGAMPRDEWLTSLAILLSKFGEKYGASMMKIGKIGDFSAEAEQMANAMSGIFEDKFEGSE